MLGAIAASLALSASGPLSLAVRGSPGPLSLALRGSSLPHAVLRGALRLPSRPAVRMMAGNAAKDNEEEERLGAAGKGGHQVRGAPALSAEEQAVQSAVMEHQKGAARLSQAEDARSLVGYSNGYAVLSTLSKQLEGYPSGSLVGFATDQKGLPVFCFSAMSSHTQDLMRDPKGEAAADLHSQCRRFQIELILCTYSRRRHTCVTRCRLHFSISHIPQLIHTRPFRRHSHLIHPSYLTLDTSSPAAKAAPIITACGIAGPPEAAPPCSCEGSGSLPAHFTS